MRSRYSCAWSRMLARSRLVSRRWRNWGTPALTALKPASVRVRAARRLATALRVPASARATPASAVRVAERAVIPKLAPSTATTSSVEAKKIFAARPNRTGLVALEPGIRRVVFAQLVLVRHPAEAARIELDLEPGHTRRPDGELLHRLRAPLVPDVQGVAAGGDVLDREAPVRRRLGEVARRHHLNEGDHARVDVAEQDRKSTRLNSSHGYISYAVFCLKKKTDK